MEKYWEGIQKGDKVYRWNVYLQKVQVGTITQVLDGYALIDCYGDGKIETVRFSQKTDWKRTAPLWKPFLQNAVKYCKIIGIHLAGIAVNFFSIMVTGAALFVGAYVAARLLGVNLCILPK